MMRKKLIIYGVGKFAEYAAYIFDLESDYILKGFCVEKAYLAKSDLPEHYKHLKLYEFESVPPEDYCIFIAVGNNEVRTRIFKQALNQGYTLASFTSPRAITYKNLEYGKNVLITEASGIHPFVKIGDNTIIIGSYIGHHSSIGSNCLLSSCTVAGNSKIGENCYLGINSAVSQNIKVGNKNILGMNVCIESDTEPGSVFTHKGTVKRDIDYDKVSNRFLK